jgi:hypothetical protein
MPTDKKDNGGKQSNAGKASKSPPQTSPQKKIWQQLLETEITVLGVKAPIGVVIFAILLILGLAIVSLPFTYLSYRNGFEFIYRIYPDPADVLFQTQMSNTLTANPLMEPETIGTSVSQTLAALPTESPTPTYTPTPTLTDEPEEEASEYPWLMLPDCLESDHWFLYSYESMQAPQEDGCWDASEFGIFAGDGHEVHFNYVNPDPNRIYRLMFRAVYFDETPVLKFEIMIRDPNSNQSQDSALYLGLGNIADWLNEAFFLSFYFPRTMGIDFRENVQSFGDDLGGFDFYLPALANEIVVEISLDGNQLMIYIDNRLVVNQTVDSSQIAGLWIGFNTPNNGVINATITQLETGDQ